MFSIPQKASFPLPLAKGTCGSIHTHMWLHIKVPAGLRAISVPIHKYLLHISEHAGPSHLPGLHSSQISFCFSMYGQDFSPCTNYLLLPHYPHCHTRSSAILSHSVSSLIDSPGYMSWLYIQFVFFSGPLSLDFSRCLFMFSLSYSQ